MSTLLRSAGISILLLLSACGKEPAASADAPLSYVPVDTPYVFANIEPLPKAVMDQWSKQMEQIWPLTWGMYSRMLEDAKDLSDGNKRIASAIIDELKSRDSMDKLREIGIKPEALGAMYGIGLVPVIRIELTDAALFRATIERVEAKSGAKLSESSIGEQRYWFLGDSKLNGIAALVGNQLVLTIAPADASEDLRKQLLGITKPQSSLQQADTLSAFNRQHSYLPNGSGYVDVVRLVDLISGERNAVQREFANALGLEEAKVDAVCRKEYLQIAAKFPRFGFGYTELQAKHMALSALFEVEPGLAGELVAATGVAPGSADKIRGMLDISIAMPVLKIKDFWLKQLGKISDAPYECSELAKMNASVAEAKGKLAVTIPPPASDLTGMRISLSSLQLDGKNGKPDGSGKLLIGLTNPMSAVAMGQLALPALKDVQIKPDGQPVNVPDSLAFGLAPIVAAMSERALALAVGKDETKDLTEFLNAPASKDAVFVRMGFTGELYSLIAKTVKKTAELLPETQREQMNEQVKMLELYALWFRSGEFRLTATPRGVQMVESIDMN